MIGKWWAVSMKDKRSLVFLCIALLVTIAGGCRWERNESFMDWGSKSDEEAADATVPSGEAPGETPVEADRPAWNYLGASAPGGTPALFLPGVVSTGNDERDAVFSPEGNEFYYTLASPEGARRHDIVRVRRVGDSWTGPEVVSFSTGGNNMEPFVTVDGEKLFFASDRPARSGGNSRDFNIWVAERSGDSWGDPVEVGGAVQSAENEIYPSVARNGTLYFTAARPGGEGGKDLYRAPLVDGLYGEVENLGNAINTEHDEFNAFIEPNEHFIIFSSMGREDGVGGIDLYVSYRAADGTWSKARNLGDRINSKSVDYCPFVTNDGKYLFFTSCRPIPAMSDDARMDYTNLNHMYQSPGNGLGDIYWVDATFLWEGIR